MASHTLVKGLPVAAGAKHPSGAHSPEIRVHATPMKCVGCEDRDATTMRVAKVSIQDPDVVSWSADDQSVSDEHSGATVSSAAEGRYANNGLEMSEDDLVLMKESQDSNPPPAEKGILKHKKRQGRGLSFSVEATQLDDSRDSLPQNGANVSLGGHGSSSLRVWKLRVECCHNCSRHAAISGHDESKYKRYLNMLRERLGKEGVVMAKKARVGSFEVYLEQRDMKTLDLIEEKLMYSKLKTRAFPRVDAVCESISVYQQAFVAVHKINTDDEVRVVEGLTDALSMLEEGDEDTDRSLAERRAALLDNGLAKAIMPLVCSPHSVMRRHSREVIFEMSMADADALYNEFYNEHVFLTGLFLNTRDAGMWEFCLKALVHQLVSPPLDHRHSMESDITSKRKSAKSIRRICLHQDIVQSPHRDDVVSLLLSCAVLEGLMEGLKIRDGKLQLEVAKALGVVALSFPEVSEKFYILKGVETLIDSLLHNDDNVAMQCEQILEGLLLKNKESGEEAGGNRFIFDMVTDRYHALELHALMERVETEELSVLFTSSLIATVLSQDPSSPEMSQESAEPVLALQAMGKLAKSNDRFRYVVATLAFAPELFRLINDGSDVLAYRCLKVLRHLLSHNGEAIVDQVFQADGIRLLAQLLFDDNSNISFEAVSCLGQFTGSMFKARMSSHIAELGVGNIQALVERPGVDDTVRAVAVRVLFFMVRNSDEDVQVPTLRYLHDLVIETDAVASSLENEEVSVLIHCLCKSYSKDVRDCAMVILRHLWENNILRDIFLDTLGDLDSLSDLVRLFPSDTDVCHWVVAAYIQMLDGPNKEKELSAQEGLMNLLQVKEACAKFVALGGAERLVKLILECEESSQDGKADIGAYITPLSLVCDEPSAREALTEGKTMQVIIDCAMNSTDASTAESVDSILKTLSQHSKKVNSFIYGKFSTQSPIDLSSLFQNTRSKYLKGWIICVLQQNSQGEEGVAEDETSATWNLVRCVVDILEDGAADENTKTIGANILLEVTDISESGGPLMIARSGGLFSVILGFFGGQSELRYILREVLLRILSHGDSIWAAEGSSIDPESTGLWDHVIKLMANVLESKMVKGVSAAFDMLEHYPTDGDIKEWLISAVLIVIDRVCTQQPAFFDADALELRVINSAVEFIAHFALSEYPNERDLLVKSDALHRVLKVLDKCYFDENANAVQQGLVKAAVETLDGILAQRESSGSKLLGRCACAMCMQGLLRIYHETSPVDGVTRLQSSCAGAIFETMCSALKRMGMMRDVYVEVKDKQGNITDLRRLAIASVGTLAKTGDRILPSSSEGGGGGFWGFYEDKYMMTLPIGQYRMSWEAVGYHGDLHHSGNGDEECLGSFKNLLSDADYGGAHSALPIQEVPGSVLCQTTCGYPLQLEMTCMVGVQLLVVDGSSGEPLHGIWVEMKPDGGEVTVEAKTSKEGFVHAAVIGGLYEIRIKAQQGYKEETAHKHIYSFAPTSVSEELTMTLSTAGLANMSNESIGEEREEGWETRLNELCRQAHRGHSNTEAKSKEPIQGSKGLLLF